MFKMSLAIATLAPLLFAFSTADDLPSLGLLLIPSVIIILLIIVNGLFVMAEFALIGVRPSQVEQLANEGHGTAKHLLSILRSPTKQNDYIATAQLGITLASIGLGMYGEPQISHFIEAYLAWLFNVEIHDTVVTTTGYLVALGLLTYLHIVVGEMVPKSLALASPRRAVLSVAQPMRVAGAIFALPVRLLNRSGDALLRLGRIPPAEGHNRLHSTEELEFIVSESAEGGALEVEAQEILQNIFTFSERQVQQVMTPRNKIDAIPFDMPLSSAAAPYYKQHPQSSAGLQRDRGQYYRHFARQRFGAPSAQS